MHSCLVWSYRKTVTEIKLNGVVIKSRVNTGWGGTDFKKDRVWNAYDINGC